MAAGHSAQVLLSLKWPCAAVTFTRTWFSEAFRFGEEGEGLLPGFFTDINAEV